MPIKPKLTNKQELLKKKRSKAAYRKNTFHGWTHVTMDSGNQNDLTITFCTKQPDKNILVKMTRLIAKMIAFSRSFKSLQLLAHAPVNNGAGGKRSDKTPAAVAVNFKSRHGKQEYASAYMEIAGHKLHLHVQKDTSCQQPHTEQSGTLPKDINNCDNHKEIGQDAKD